MSQVAFTFLLTHLTLLEVNELLLAYPQLHALILSLDNPKKQSQVLEGKIEGCSRGNGWGFQ